MHASCCRSLHNVSDTAILNILDYDDDDDDDDDDEHGTRLVVLFYHCSLQNSLAPNQEASDALTPGPMITKSPFCGRQHYF